jgi:hypothetical protein
MRAGVLSMRCDGSRLGRAAGSEVRELRARRRELCPHATIRSVAIFICGEVWASLQANLEANVPATIRIVVYVALRRDIGRTLPARNNPKRCDYDISGIV